MDARTLVTSECTVTKGIRRCFFLLVFSALIQFLAIHLASLPCPFPALHPDSVTELALFVDGQVQFEWSATPGTTDLQEIPGLAGVEAASFVVQGIQDFGETLGIVEVRDG